MADLVNGYILEVYATGRACVAGGKTEVAPVKNDVGVDDLTR